MIKVRNGYCVQSKLENMKLKNLILFVGLYIFSSCTPTVYYQYCKVKPDLNIAVESNRLIYQDENCSVIYNLWDSQGNIGFEFHNKTNQDIYINKEKTFYILNGIAYNYFQDRTYTKINKADYYGNFQGGYSSVTLKEDRLICIPSGKSKIINEYKVTNKLYEDCDYKLYPLVSEIKSQNFSATNSPIVFSNIISYIVGENGIEKLFENKFYVSEITNYPGTKVEGYDYKQCNFKIYKLYLKNSSPDKFYLKYNLYQQVY